MEDQTFMKPLTRKERKKLNRMNKNAEGTNDPNDAGPKIDGEDNDTEIFSKSMLVFFHSLLLTCRNVVLEYLISKTSEIFRQQSQFDEVYVGNGWFDSARQANESYFENNKKQQNLECCVEFDK
jgi:hypothetical protein